MKEETINQLDGMLSKLDTFVRTVAKTQPELDAVAQPLMRSIHDLQDQLGEEDLT